VRSTEAEELMRSTVKARNTKAMPMRSTAEAKAAEERPMRSTECTSKEVSRSAVDAANEENQEHRRGCEQENCRGR
jgi:hypothetical protein